MTAEKTINKTNRYLPTVLIKRVSRTLIFGSNSNGRNETSNACTPTIGVKKAYQSARELPAPHIKVRKEMHPKMQDMTRTNYAGMSAVDNQAPSGSMFG